MKGTWLVASLLLTACTPQVVQKPIASSNAPLAGEAALNHLLRTRACNRCDFSSMNLSNQNFAGLSLIEANFRHADLTNTNLQGADLTGATLKEADLTRANLLYADLENANLQHANSTGTHLGVASDLTHTAMPDGSLHL